MCPQINHSFWINRLYLPCSSFSHSNLPHGHIINQTPVPVGLFGLPGYCINHVVQANLQPSRGFWLELCFSFHLLKTVFKVFQTLLQGINLCKWKCYLAFSVAACRTSCRVVESPGFLGACSSVLKEEEWCMLLEWSSLLFLCGLYMPYSKIVATF